MEHIQELIESLRPLNHSAIKPPPPEYASVSN